MTLLTDLLGSVAPIGATGVPGASGAIGATGISALAIANVQIADSSYTVLDDTAANTTGGYLVLTGTGFTSNCVVIVGSTNAISTSYVNSTTLRSQVGSFAAATYNLYVVDTVTGATAIKVNGLTTSSFPAWSTGSTLTGQIANTAFGINVSATSDSSITYANTTVLPTGTTLLANGYFYGTVTIGTTTTYSFGIDAKDAENQDATRTFGLTVTVTPQTRLYTWGRNNNGQLGENDRVTQQSPIQIGSGTTWNLISIGSNYSSIATKNDGTLWLWGYNNYGQLGTNDQSPRSSPVQIGSDTTWSKVSMGSIHAAAIKTDGTLWTWGRNQAGQLGFNNRTNVSSPTQMGSDTTWSLVSAGLYVTASIKTDGTLWLWGYNDYGQLGTGDRVYKSSPTQIGSGTTWSQVSISSSRSAIATKTDGTLWAWGYNTNGQLGLNNTTNYSSPHQVGSLTNWSQVSAGYKLMIATKTDGTLWTWGLNNYGQLGLGNNTVYKSSPTQVGVLTTWSLVCGGYNAAGAIRTDNTLWLWGYNDYGQLGQYGDTARRSSPIQVGASNWTKLGVGNNGAMAITTN